MICFQSLTWIDVNMKSLCYVVGVVLSSSMIHLHFLFLIPILALFSFSSSSFDFV